MLLFPAWVGGRPQKLTARVSINEGLATPAELKLKTNVQGQPYKRQYVDSKALALQPLEHAMRGGDTGRNRKSHHEFKTAGGIKTKRAKKGNGVVAWTFPGLAGPRASLAHINLGLAR